METKVIREIIIDAPREKVWQALTDPEITKKYFFHCRVLSDWKPGSPIVFKGKIFWIVPVKLEGEILQIDPGKMLQYTIENHGTRGSSLVTDELFDENGKTRLKITDDVGHEPGAEKRYRKSQAGWDKILRGLKRTIET